MAPADPMPGQSQGLREVVEDLWQLIRDYAKQETLDPLLRLKRFFAWGLGGAILVTLGLIYGTLAVIRVLQEETGDHLTGSLNWVPYVGGCVFAGVATVIAVRMIMKPFASQETKP